MSENRSRIFTILKWSAASLLFLILAAGAASWYFSIKYRPAIAKELKALVLASTKGLYRLDFSAIHTNFLTGSAWVSDVVLTPDTNVYKRLVEEDKAPDNIYKLRLKKLLVSRFHPWQLFVNKKLIIKELLFDKPELTMINKHYAFNENKPPRPRQSPYDLISKFLKSVSIREVNFKDVGFKYVNNNSAVAEVDSVSKLNIYLTDYLIDAHSAADTTRLYLFKDVQIQVNNYSYNTPDNMYTISLEQLDFTASGGRLYIKKFAMLPLFSEMDFGKKAGYAKDRFDIRMNDISMKGLVLPLFVKKREVYADHMQISNGSLSVFSNNSLPKRSSPKTGQFPHQLLQKLKTQLTIKKIDLKDIDISYSEFDRDSRRRGRISFDKTSGVIVNATNAPKAKKADPVMKAQLVTNLMGRGNLTVNFNFSLNSPSGAFSYNGKLLQLEGRAMNQITKPLGMVIVNGGRINDLSFIVRADEKKAVGTMAFRFNDLSVTLLRKEAGKDKLIRQGLVSFLANNLVLFSDNPSLDGRFTRAPMYYERPPASSFFSYIWRTLFTGIKISVGVSPAKEREIRAQVAKFEKMKEDRDLRRAERERRRKKS